MGDAAEDAGRRADVEREEEGTPSGTEVCDLPANDTPSVIQAISRVMGDVQSIGKDQENKQQHYVFRGIDAVMNAVGPALREHGVVVVPIHVEYDVERYQTSKGTEMKGVTAIITFRFYGPAGDYIEAQAAGESSDAGDKAMPKVHSVAYRTLLLQALCIPTGDPDPDASSHERASSGSRGTPPAAREQKQQDTRPRDKNGVAFDVPMNWKQIGEAFEKEFVDAEWLSEAIVAKFGRERRELEGAEQIKAGTMLQEMYVAMMQILGPQVFPGAKRADLRRAFAPALEGLELEGPPWRIHDVAFDPDEADYPARVVDEIDPDAEAIPFGESASAEDAPMGDDEPPDYSG